MFEEGVVNKCLEVVAKRKVRCSVNKPDEAKRFEAYAVEKSDDPYSVAIKELVRVTHEQNAVIEKLSEQIRELGGKGVEDIPKVNVGNIGVSTRRARHHRQKKKAVETPQDPQS